MVLVDIFLLRDDPYRHACENPRAPVWISAFIVATGALFGVLSAVFQRVVGGEIGGYPLDQIPDWILFLGNIVPGILIAVAVHIGIAIISWLMVKGVSGRGRMVLLYRATAYLLPLGAPALPYIASSRYTPAEIATLPLQAAYTPLAGLGLCLFAIGLFKVMQVVEGVPPIRAALAVALFGLFCGSILLIV